MAHYMQVPYYGEWYDDEQSTMMPVIIDDSFASGLHDHQVEPRYFATAAAPGQAVRIYPASVMARQYQQQPPPPPPPPMMRQYQIVSNRMRSGVSNVSVERSKFQIMLDVQQFCPNEIQVKTVDNYIIIEGKHEEKEDEHGYVARHFVRRYLLPKGVKPESVTSTISCDGVLTVTAPRQGSTGSCEVRQVQVTPVNQPVLCSTCPTGGCVSQKSIHEPCRVAIPPAPPSPKACPPPPCPPPAPACQPCITVCASNTCAPPPGANGTGQAQSQGRDNNNNAPALQVAPAQSLAKKVN